MKKRYDDEVSKRTIPDLELYTQLIGLVHGALGINSLLFFMYWKYILKWKGPWVILYFSIFEFLSVPIGMTSTRKCDRDLSAVILWWILHGILTIPIIVYFRFWVLLIAYVIEIAVAVGVTIHYYQGKHVKKKKKKRKR